MSDEEIQGLIQNAFQKTLKELQENPDNVFNYLELQEKYNRVLKDKVNLHQENKKLKDVIDKAIKYNKQVIKDIKDFYRPTEDIIYSGDTLIDIAEQNLDILKEVK